MSHVQNFKTFITSDKNIICIKTEMKCWTGISDEDNLSYEWEHESENYFIGTEEAKFTAQGTQTREAK